MVKKAKTTSGETLMMFSPKHYSLAIDILMVIQVIAIDQLIPVSKNSLALLVCISITGYIAKYALKKYDHAIKGG